ncbi:hypothetical protein E0I61_11015 [Flavobacterium ranwuense]|uniref:RiboL-PSP-HEPN domain-containing protein n=1 Tax=Flavobacterium ranwuense TaxID=2541725 RepID=A0ABY2DRH8_9FLAO|nr:hypothetical protein [Flavobacterium ranwuense]TDE28912.1 hypothetical protein E0I61_11015 [Flavobacterium ranwuense]
MNNEYKIFLDNYFSTLLEFIHNCRRLNKVITLDFEKYTQTGSVFNSNSTLILSDWTGKTDNGWVLPFHSGLFKSTSKENYKSEMISVLSREFCLMYCQSYESLEKFFKDCVFYKAKNDLNFREEIKIAFKIEGELTREDMKGGDLLYKAVKKIGKETLQKLSKENNTNIKFGELLKILSEVRHSITHSKSVINKSKIDKTQYHNKIFEFLFSYSEITNEHLKIELDFKKFEYLIIKLAEFAFQIFKAISIEEKLNWNYEK